MKKHLKPRVGHWQYVPREDSAFKPMGTWLSVNHFFYDRFRKWLRNAPYGDSALSQYGVAARLALGLLDKPYWLIDPEADLTFVRTYLAEHYPQASTRQAYLKGLAKFEEYVRVTCHRPRRERVVHWDYYLQGLSTGLAEEIQRYVTHRRRTWRPESAYEATIDLVSPLTRPLRWLATHSALETFPDLTPARWFEYLEARLAAGIQPTTVNIELNALRALVLFLQEEGLPICTRSLKIDALKPATHLPRDIPMDQLQQLWQTVETDGRAEHAGVRRMGLMDRAWFLLMLHSGLRTGEVRRLKLTDVDLKGRKVRIEQSKGLKDRVVYLSPATVSVLDTYLNVRGPASGVVDYVFLYRHKPLTQSYLFHRLGTYAERRGVTLTPHQLRHSCAMLLLNAGAPLLTVKTILGHQHVDTTHGYARLYDETLAADYYRAMAQVEQRFAAQNEANSRAPSINELLALIDSLASGMPSDILFATVDALRIGISALMLKEG